MPASSIELMSFTLYDSWFSFLNCYFISSSSKDSLFVRILDFLFYGVIDPMDYFIWVPNLSRIMVGVRIIPIGFFTCCLCYSSSSSSGSMDLLDFSSLSELLA